MTAINRLAPLLRAPARGSFRSITTSRVLFNAKSGEAEGSPDFSPPVEITESHRRDVRSKDGPVSDAPQNTFRRQVNRTRYTKPSSPNRNPKADQADEQTTDFFDSPEGASSVSSKRTGPKSGLGELEAISMDILSSAEISEFANRKKGSGKGGAGQRQAQGQGQGQGQGQRQRIYPGQGQGQGQRGGRRDSRSPTAGSASLGGPGRGGPGGQRSGPGGAGGARDRGPPRDRDRDGDREGKSSAPVPRGPNQHASVVYDTSPSALFGLGSLISPARRGARDAAGAFWATDMAAGDARKADLMRLAGSYDLRLPSSSHPSELKDKATPVERAKANARWAMALNPTVPMRVRDPGVEVVDRLLR
ncbi:uncharacterized protein MKK02DRAFT_41552 [Dioszegia hungarica]|uniref:Uncharacterized protein n=1 Tax=Dioszegia hungarica TaxID=4972 RepID=A0AA38LQR8_9TREE|nr:uncharacterized protein MKK02DRAFT_41552 [Dioszegia hungarica]KAI9631918.1 hypothetical protein MKK02DRAFT_41552 [Dioszegia hungarica]